MKSNVLVYEPCLSNIPSLTFVLGIGQFGCTHARTAGEALNWLAAARLKIISFDLVLVSSLSAEDLEAEFLAVLPILQIPVVFLQRDKDVGINLSSANAQACTPDNLIQCLQKVTS